MLARSIALVVVIGMPAAAVAGGCGSGSRGVASNSVGSGGSAGAPDAGAETSFAGGPPGPSCTDGIKNGSETDVDCGGSCQACNQGQACSQDADCGANVCHGSQCCSTSTYTRSTGLVSGSGTVCCDGNDVRTAVTDCGDGQNHSASPEGANCAQGVEGAQNGGDACAQVTCQKFDCSVVVADGGTD